MSSGTRAKVCPEKCSIYVMYSVCFSVHSNVFTQFAHVQNGFRDFERVRPIARSPTIPKCIYKITIVLRHCFFTPSRRGHPSVQLSTRALLSQSHVYGIELALLKSAKSKPPKWLKRASQPIRLCDTKWQNTHAQRAECASPPNSPNHSRSKRQ